MPGYSLDAKFRDVGDEFLYTLQRLQNVNESGNGTPLQPVIKAGYSVSPVNSITVISSAALGAESTRVVLRFFEPSRMYKQLGCYNIYIKDLNGEKEWQLIHTAKHSPASFHLLPSSAGQIVTFAVQTELRNGQRLEIDKCPTVAATLI